VINFPNSPLIGDTYTLGSKTWVWNGAAWDVEGGGGGGGGGSGSSSSTISLTNNSGGTLVQGMPVYSNGSGTVSKAIANSQTTSRFVGLVSDLTIANAASGNVITDGVLTAATSAWDALTGQSGGLTYGVTYYLSPTTAGHMTTTAPSTYVVEVGIGLSTTQLKILSTNFVL